MATLPLKKAIIICLLLCISSTYISYGQNYAKEIAALRDSIGFKRFDLEPDTIIERAKELIAIAQIAGDKRAIAFAYHRTGDAFLTKNQDYSAVDNYGKALEFYTDPLDARQYNFAAVNMYSTMINIGELQEAKERFLKLLKKVRAEKDTASLIAVYETITLSYDVNKPASRDSVLKMLDTCIYLCKKINYYTGLTDAVQQYADILIKIGDFRPNSIFEQLKSLLDSAKIKSDIGRQKYINESLVQYYLGRKDFANAAIHISNHNDLLKEEPTLYDSTRYFYLNASLQAANGNYKSAFEQMEMYNTLYLRYQQEQNLIETSGLRAKYDLKQSEKDNIKLQEEKQAKDKLILRQWLIMALSAILALVIALAAYFINRYKAQSQKNKYELAIRKNELKALRAQLNPHFVQNTFNLMAKQVFTGNKDETVETISKISVYIRKILHRSDYNVSTLEEEIDYTEEYLQIQQMLAPHLFKFNIDIEDNIDTFGIKVPTMLLQPIVENCIKHGFSSMRSGGEINIKIYAQNNWL